MFLLDLLLMEKGGCEIENNTNIIILLEHEQIFLICLI